MGWVDIPFNSIPLFHSDTPQRIPKLTSANGYKIRPRPDLTSLAASLAAAAAAAVLSLYSAMSGDEHIDIDTSDVRNCHAPPSKKLVAVPIDGGSSGEGLPYAPENWPQHGDKWTWRVGYRASGHGTWLDRSVFLPSRFSKSVANRGFHSRVSLEEYIRKEYPEADVNAFFSSFIWKIPVSGETKRKEKRKSDGNDRYGSGSTRGGDCKAGNKLCSLNMNTRSSSLAAKACDVCCTESGFCRNCSCILCTRSIDWASAGGYSFIKCEASLEENYICGHVAHIDCALRCYLAGTVGGSIDLDVQYYCRRCDNKSDLIPRVTKLIKTCEILDSQDDILKILTMGLCLMRNPKQARAVYLKNHIQTVIAKLKGGVNRNDIWNVEDNIPAFNAGDEAHEINKATSLGVADIKRNSRPSDSSNCVEPSQGKETSDGRLHMPVYITSDPSNTSLKLEDQVDQVLKNLKKSQESEYTIVEQKLNAQKDLLLSLYQQIRTESAQITSANGGNDAAHVAKVSELVKQTEHHEVKLDSMLKIANGFGHTPKNVLTEYFGLRCED